MCVTSKSREDRIEPELLHRFARKFPHCWEAEMCWALFSWPCMVHKILGKGLKWKFPISTPVKCKRNRTEMKIPWQLLSHVVSSRRVKGWDQWVEHRAQLVSQGWALCTQHLLARQQWMGHSLPLKDMPDLSIFMLAPNMPFLPHSSHFLGHPYGLFLLLEPSWKDHLEAKSLYYQLLF